MFSTFRALKIKPFALLCGCQTISRLGDAFFRVALIWWVVEKTGSSVVMGTVLIFSTVPMLVFLLLGGVLVDRLPRLSLMIFSDLGRGLLVGVITLLSLVDALEVWHVYLLSAFFGLVDAFFAPAFRAVVPELTPAEHLPSANSLNSLSNQVTGILGPALGAGFVAFGGSTLAFGLNAFSFMLAGVLLLPLLKQSTVPSTGDDPSEELASIWKDAYLGLRTVKDTPWLWITIAVAGISNLTYAGPMGVALPFLVSDHLHADVSVLGLFFSFSSAGALLAALWLGHYKTVRRRGLKMYAAWMLIGLMVVAIGLPIGIPAILFASLVIGAANTILGLIWVNILQERVLGTLLGRVSSVDYLGSSLLEPVGYALGGWMNNLLGPALTFIIGGGLQVVLIALGLLHRDVRDLD